MTILIEELTAGQPITLIAVIGEERLLFETTVLEAYPKKHLVLAAPIYRDEKVLSFRVKNLRLSLEAPITDDLPFLFKNVSISLMRKPDDTLCYSISSQTEGKPNNRRNSFRCFLGLETALQCGANHRTYKTIIRDVSLGGFSVVCDAEADFSQNQVIHVLLKDYIEDLAENYAFHLYGIIVRRQELENNRVLYGCRQNNKVTGLDSYIAKKERMRLRNTGGRIDREEKQ